MDLGRLLGWELKPTYPDFPLELLNVAIEVHAGIEVNDRVGVEQQALAKDL